MNWTDVGKALHAMQQLQGPYNMIKELFDKLNPSISINKEGEATKVTVTVDRSYLEVHHELDMILDNVKQIKLNNLIVELRLRDKLMRLTDENQEKQG